MREDRRRVLKATLAGGGVALALRTGLLWPRAAQAETTAAWPQAAFAAKSADAVIAALFPGMPIEPSSAIRMKLPALAEDGRVVPLTVHVDMPQVDSICIIGEKNPIPLIGQFELGQGVEPYLSTRIKLAETSHVIVVAAAAGKLYSNSKQVKVVIGGCDV